MGHELKRSSGEYLNSRSLIGLTLAQSRSLLDKGFFKVTLRCIGGYGPYRFKTAKDQSVKGGISKVDYDALVNNESKILLGVKSPSALKKASLVSCFHRALLS